MNSSNEVFDFELPILELEKRIDDLQTFSQKESIDCEQELALLYLKLKKVIRDTYAQLTPWQRVQLSRHPERPYTRDYISYLFNDFFEIKGDRYFSDDPAIVCGFGKIDGRTLGLIGHQKGRDMKEKIACHFGCAHPEGYRKALRMMKLCEKMKISLLILIDTPGAFPGIAAEERGQAYAIAKNIMAMTHLSIPTIAIVIGEGGSGGALGVGVADVVSIMENAYYSVISPEGCSAILWKDKTKVQEAASILKIMPNDLLKMKIVDEVIAEPLGGAHRDHKKASDLLKESILKYLRICEKIPLDNLLRRRLDKYKTMDAGLFKEGG